MKRWLSRRKQALVDCAPISDAPPSNRAMRSALESARTIPEAAASLTDQQQFDHALARLVAKIEIPKEAEEWFVNVALIKGVKRSWKKTARHPAILSTVLAFLVLLGLCIFFFVEHLEEFPGSETAKKMLVVASNTHRADFEPIHTDAINLGDYFFMKFQLEHFEAPIAFADLQATGARVFDDEEGRRVAQVALAESGLQFFFFPADKSDLRSPTAEGKTSWGFVENEGWTGAVEERDGVCFMIAKRGSKAELKPFLAEHSR
ncbi:MAG TPA: hypothetical protein VGG02_05650 [Chthoniobacterales bacterium]|jgi:hypothetical protein